MFYYQINDNLFRKNDSSFILDADSSFILGYLDANMYSPYKSYKPQMPLIKTEKEKKALEIMILYSYIHDLNLLLDVNPTDEYAMGLFKEHSEKLRRLEDEYQKTYSPLFVTESKNVDGYFNWLTTKSPWLGGM